MVRNVEYPLYRPEQERDACGTGFVADIHGRPSHAILDMAVTAVTNLTHRGALDADALTGDGAGVSFQLPRDFFADEVRALGQEVRPEDVAVGMVFLPAGDEDEAGRVRHAMTVAVSDQGLRTFGWRVVPVDPSVLGDAARKTPRARLRGRRIPGRRSPGE